jgi:small-conductance mechanosensitive channel
MTFERLGVGLPILADGGSIAAAVLVASAAVGGWIAGRLVGVRIETWVAERASNFAGGFAGRLCGLTRYVTAAVMLAAFTGLAPAMTAPGRLVLVGALGVALALVIYQLARSFRAGTAVAGAVALAVGIWVVADRLGGLDPLVAGLDRAAISFGKIRLSLLDVLNFLAIAVLLFGVARGAVRLGNRAIANIDALDLSQRVLAQKLSQISVVALAFFIGIDLLGIDLTALAVFSGALGLAVGFGLQKTFGNLIAGLILLMDRSIKPGDVIVVGNTFGWVNKISVRYVSVLTRDGKEHLIPNEELMTKQVENWSYSNRNVRLHIKISVPHDCDIGLAQRLMLDATHDHPRILADPEPVCWVTALGLNGIEHEVRIWIDDPEAGVTNVQSDILNRTWASFREHGIMVPRQQHDIYVRQTPASSG